MRICIVARSVSPYSASNVSTAQSAAALLLASCGHEVTLLTRDGERARLEAELPGVAIRFVTDAWYLGEHVNDVFPYPSMAHAMGVYQALLALSAEQPFDLVQFADRGGEGYFALRGKRTLGQFPESVFALSLFGTTQSCDAQSRADWFTRAEAALLHQETEALLLADVVHGPSEALLRDARELGRTTAVKIPPAFVRGGEPPRTGPRDTLLFADRLELRRGPLELLEAALPLLAQDATLRLRFAGEDTHTAPLVRSVAAFLRQSIPPALSSRITVEGPLSGAALAHAIDAARVICFPARDPELPWAGLLALERGAAIVTGPGGAGELVEDGVSGLVAEGPGAAPLGRALQRSLDSATLRDALSQGGQERLTTALGGHVEAIEALVERSRAKRRPSKPRAAKSSAPLVSVIVPFHNLARWLPETLASIEAQTLISREIIVVDDGSTEPASLALLETLERPGLRVVRKRNGGLSSARNAGLAAARGRWVLPLDADDLIHGTFLEKCVGALQREPKLAYATTLVRYFNDDPRRPTGGYVPWGLARDVLGVMNVAGTCTALFDRARLEAVGGYDETMTSYEDWDVYCSLAERGERAAIIPEFLFFYRWRADSMTRTEVSSKRNHLRALLARKHPHLAEHPDRTQRLMLAEAVAIEERLFEAQRWNLKQLVAQSSLGRRLELDANSLGLPQPLRQALDGLRQRLGRGNTRR